MSLTRHLQVLPEPLFSDYDVHNKPLGVGAYAIVYKVTHKRTKEDFALKVIEKEPMRVRLLAQQLRREVELVEELSTGTPHVVQLLETTETATHFLLRFELCTTSMEDVSDMQGPMPEEQALQWMRQACLGVKEIHAKGVIHRDLKPSNMLVDTDGSLAICDFGAACRATDDPIGITGTPNYSPPETQSHCDCHTEKVDIYSLGASLQHLLLGRVPLGSEDFPKGLSDSTRELLEEMMSPDPEDRPSIDDLLNSPQIGGSLIKQWLSQWHIITQGFVGH
jgi:serine/threonine protein kinase